jgi:hypothetical protein
MADNERPSVSSAERYLLFVSKPTGYELAEREGEPPSPGTEIEDGDTRFVVAKVGPSPLPGDARPCAYLEQA